MGTIIYYQPIGLSSNLQVFNETSIDYSNSNHSNTIEQSINLIVFIVLWAVLLVTIILGTTGNILVLYVYSNRKDSKTCTFFIKILAIVDLIICLILAPLELYQITIGNIVFN
jgi:hypothetical protein